MDDQDSPKNENIIEDVNIWRSSARKDSSSEEDECPPRDNGSDSDESCLMQFTDEAYAKKMEAHERDWIAHGSKITGEINEIVENCNELIAKNRPFLPIIHPDFFDEQQNWDESDERKNEIVDSAADDDCDEPGGARKGSLLHFVDFVEDPVWENNDFFSSRFLDALDNATTCLRSIGLYNTDEDEAYLAELEQKTQKEKEDKNKSDQKENIKAQNESDAEKQEIMEALNEGEWASMCMLHDEKSSEFMAETEQKAQMFGNEMFGNVDIDVETAKQEIIETVNEEEFAAIEALNKREWASMCMPHSEKSSELKKLMGERNPTNVRNSRWDNFVRNSSSNKFQAIKEGNESQVVIDPSSIPGPSGLQNISLKKPDLLPDGAETGRENFGLKRKAEALSDDIEKPKSKQIKNRREPKETEESKSTREKRKQSDDNHHPFLKKAKLSKSGIEEAREKEKDDDASQPSQDKTSDDKPKSPRSGA